MLSLNELDWIIDMFGLKDKPTDIDIKEYGNLKWIIFSTPDHNIKIKFEEIAPLEPDSFSIIKRSLCSFDKFTNEEFWVDLNNFLTFHKKEELHE